MEHDQPPGADEFPPTPEEVEALNQSLRDLVAQKFPEAGQAQLMKNYHMPEGNTLDLAARSHANWSAEAQGSENRIELTRLGVPQVVEHMGSTVRRQIYWSVPRDPSSEDPLQISDIKIPVDSNGRLAHVRRDSMVFATQPTAEQFRIISGALEFLRQEL
jgi:hypothetical protein